MESYNLSELLNAPDKLYKMGLKELLVMSKDDLYEIYDHLSHYGIMHPQKLSLITRIVKIISEMKNTKSCKTCGMSNICPQRTDDADKKCLDKKEAP